MAVVPHQGSASCWCRGAAGCGAPVPGRLRAQHLSRPKTTQGTPAPLFRGEFPVSLLTQFVPHLTVMISFIGQQPGWAGPVQGAAPCPVLQLWGLALNQTRARRAGCDVVGGSAELQEH